MMELLCRQGAPDSILCLKLLLGSNKLEGFLLHLSSNREFLECRPAQAPLLPHYYPRQAGRDTPPPRPQNSAWVTAPLSAAAAAARPEPSCRL